MRALSKFENLMEQLFEDRSTRWLKGQLQPLDLAKKLARVMELNQSVCLDKVTAPNSYTLHLSPPDFVAFEPYRAGLERELAQYLTNLATELELVLRGQSNVSLQKDESLRRRRVRVEFTTTEMQTSPSYPSEIAQGGALFTTIIDRSLLQQQTLPKAWLTFKNAKARERRFSVTDLPCSLGRSPDNDIVVEDRRASRHHAEITEDEGKLYLVDLESTNGTMLNGKTVKRCTLEDGDMVSLGGAELIFELGGGL